MSSARRQHCRQFGVNAVMGSLTAEEKRSKASRERRGIPGGSVPLHRVPGEPLWTIR